MNKHLGLQYLIQARLVDKIEIWNNNILIYKTIWKKKKYRQQKMAQIKGKNSIASINMDKWVRNMSKEKEATFK